jgi:hypothetical protein
MNGILLGWSVLATMLALGLGVLAWFLLFIAARLIWGAHVAWIESAEPRKAIVKRDAKNLTEWVRALLPRKVKA